MGRQIAFGTGKFEDIDCGLVLKSIGYKSVPVDGLPFDPNKGVIPNARGRVLHSTSGEFEEGLYVCGWLKRGPTGIVATNLHCAEETVASISEDLVQGPLASTSRLPKPGREGLLQLLDGRNVRVLTFDDWEKIDIEEKRQGSMKTNLEKKFPHGKNSFKLHRNELISLLNLIRQIRVFVFFGQITSLPVRKSFAKYHTIL